MKREPLPTVEQLADEIRHVDLSRLKNRLAGKSLVDFEHCLIEILGELFERQRGFSEAMAELAQNTREETKVLAFMHAYNVHEHERGEFLRRFANFSPIGRYFGALLNRLSDLEDKQHDSGKPVTVSHARQLVAIINTQLERMTNQANRRNEKLDQQWNLMVNKSADTPA